MATRMKKTNVEEMIEDEVIEELTNISEEAEFVPTPAKKKPKKFGAGDYVLCRSVWPGGLHVTGQSGMVYNFKRMDQRMEIAYQDLVTLVRKGSEHITLPRIVIEDEDFLDMFPTVKAIYKENYTASDFKEILKMPENQMRRVINELPQVVKNSMMSVVATEIAAGRIDSVRKIRLLTEIFDSDFNLISDLFIR